MIASRGLLMPAHFIEAGGSGIESLLYLGVLPAQTFLLGEQKRSTVSIFALLFIRFA